MMTSRRRSIFGVVSIAVSVMAGAGLPALAQAQGSAEPLKLGMLVAMTGANAQSGFNAVVGVGMAVKEINAKGGILGRQIRIIQGDDHSDPTSAVNDARRLTSREKVDFIVGPAVSQLTLATLPVFTESKTPSISMSGSMAVTPQAGPYHFSFLPSAESQAQAIALYIDTVLHVKSAAVIHDAGAQTRSTVEVLKGELRNRKIELITDQEYDPTATDMTPQLLPMRRSNPDVLLALTANGTDTGYVIKGLNDLNWNVKVVGNISVIIQPGVVTKVAGPDAFKNVVALNYKALTYCTGDPVGGSDVAKFKTRLQAEVGDKYPQYSPLVLGYFYDMTHAIAAAIAGAKSVDGAAVAAWMEQNAGSIKVMNANMSASKTSHFLIGSSALTMAENADKPRADGMQKRSGC